MTKHTWHGGPPPEPGWWPACMGFRSNKPLNPIRWWDGSTWSITASPELTAIEAADFAKFKALGRNLIKWTDRWWL